MTRVALGGLISIKSSTGAITVSAAEPDMPPKEALILAGGGLCAWLEANPRMLTVATEVASEVHVTAVVRS